MCSLPWYWLLQPDNLFSWRLVALPLWAGMDKSSRHLLAHLKLGLAKDCSGNVFRDIQIYYQWVFTFLHSCYSLHTSLIPSVIISPNPDPSVIVYSVDINFNITQSCSLPHTFWLLFYSPHIYKLS